MKKIKSFTDLEVWREFHRLVKDTKKIQENIFKKTADQSTIVHKLINGLIRSIKNNQPTNL